MNTVTILNLKEYMEKETDGKRTTVGDNEKALIKGTHGYILTDYEYVHEIKDLITDSIRIYGADKPKDEHSFPIMATMYLVQPMSEVLDTCKKEEKSVKEFFRDPNYNWRLQGNYSTFLESLKEIGYEGDMDFAGKE